jgi:phosphatidylcholine synthase
MLPPTSTQFRAFAVHILTAAGAALALLAMIAAARGAWQEMFVWLGIAAIADGIDGPLARRFKIAQVLPRWSGDALDFVIDYTTYVFVPAFAIALSGLLPPIADIAVALAIVVSGAIYFADRDMKLPGDFFRGFPVLWNIVAFYLFLIVPPPWIGVAILVLLIVLTFAPFRFIHPVRVTTMRNFNLALLALWVILALVGVLRDLDPGLPIVVALCAIGIYFFAFGLVHRPRDTSG